LLLYSVSLHHMPSTLLNAGTPEQQQKYVRDGLSGSGGHCHVKRSGHGH